MKNFVLRTLVLFFFFSLLLSEDGDIISYNQQTSLDLWMIEFFLDGGGITGSNPTYPITIYDIQYESQRSDGTIDTLAGLVSIPLSPLEAFPIISYQHGTIILDENAPSITGATANNYEVLLIALVSSPAGMITLFPDYEGLGDPDKYHPYIIADSYTRAVVNMIRAVKNLSYILTNENRFQFNDQLYLFGYSEGGYDTLAAQKGIQLHFSEELNVTASCPMAGPYNLSETTVDYFLSIPSYEQPYYVPYVLTSHLWYYDGLDADFNQYFEPFWADTLASLFDGSHSGDEINTLMPANPLEILLEDELQDFTENENNFFRQTFLENNLTNWSPVSPTYLLHSLGDSIIIASNSQTAYDSFIENGAENVFLNLYPEETGGHADAAPTLIFDAFNIIKDYQIINPLGDINGDGILFNDDIASLSNSLLTQNVISDYQWWAGDLDFDEDNTIFDMLLLVDLLQN